jgi:hypothetical protein
MRFLLKVFPAGHLVISALFVACALMLIWFALHDLWKLAVSADDAAARVQGVLNAIALLTVAVATLELGQTIIEEEVQREAQMATPTRVRRFLSRFMIVLVVALSIETLVAVFEFSRNDPAQLPYAAAIGFTAAALLASWGLFVYLNRSAEELEPEAMQKAKEEDEEIEARTGKADQPPTRRGARGNGRR